MFPSLTMFTQLRTCSYAPVRVVYDLQLYDTLYIIELQCTFSVVAIVSSLIQINARSATIINQELQIKLLAMRYAIVYGDFTFADFALIIFKHQT